MLFVFAIQLIAVLLMFQPVASYNCDQADWQVTLDRKGWSKCPKDNTYLRGLWRHESNYGDERVGRIEFGKCCPATESGYANQPATCTDRDFPFDNYDNNNKWALCPNGYYLNGLELNKGPPAYLNNIARGQCCHPKNHPNSYENCYDEDVSISFDNIGWSTCTKEGYYMTGFFKSTCNNLYCIETFKCCKMKKAVVNGGWSTWGNFGKCSVTCGAGTKQRSRTCTNPPPSAGGAYCSGPSKNTVHCNDGPCPIDGGWSGFGYWSSCSRKCGGGTRKRRRTCTNPPPSNGGKSCTGHSLELQVCNTKPCNTKVDGKWTKWSKFGKCSKTCGPGKKTRTRTCTNPPPSGGGKKCKGKAIEAKNCNLGKCRGGYGYGKKGQGKKGQGKKGQGKKGQGKKGHGKKGHGKKGQGKKGHGKYGYGK